MGHDVFISGGTGYIGALLIPELIARGHRVRALARPQSVGRIPSGATAVRGLALDARTFAAGVRGCDTYVHLTGTPHPAPWKGAQFRAIDLGSLRESLRAALEARVRHFVYVSVAHPAPVMKEYIAVRTECERLLRDSGIPSSVLRPWYVLGPGHRWPFVLKPLYALAERVASTRDGARRLGLVTRAEMVNALADTVDEPPRALRILDVPAIRESRCCMIACE